jgi:N-acetylglutamate synthase
VDVARAFRRQGLARLLLADVARWAAERGAASMLLQTAVANAAAQRLYLSAGFTVHHRYDYLTPG